MSEGILIVGDGNNYFYETALYEAFGRIGCKKTELFTYGKYFNGKKRGLVGLINRGQNKLSVGFTINKINKELLKTCDEMKPELVFLYRCRAIYPKTVEKIRMKGIMVFMYNNDNPFAEYYPKYFWRHYRKSLPYCNIGFVYRKSNIPDYINAGCKRVEMLRSYYIENRNYPKKETVLTEKVPQVVFLGHYEADGRKEYIEALAQNGVEVGLHESWIGKINIANVVFLKSAVKYYNDYINASKIALVFLSAINEDTYTRRCFEIPATKTLMISVYTSDLASMFEPDKEAVYFQSKQELVEQVLFYLKNDEKRIMIGENGYSRLMKDGHEVKDRARQIIKLFEDTKKYIE